MTVEDELSAIERALSAFDDAPTEDYFGAQLMRAGLERRRAQALAARVVETPHAAEALDVSLRPPAPAEDGVELAVVASVLAALQETIQAIAQSLKDRPTSRGLVPVEIQEAVRLRVSFALPGSLDLRLVPDAPSRQQPLFEDSRETLLQLSIGSLMSLLESASTGSQGDLLQQLASVGPRATTHLETLTGALTRADTGATLRWRSHATFRASRFDSVHAAALNGTLRRVDVTTREVVLTGRLVGGSLIRRVFELELDDGSILSGKVEEPALEALETLFGRACTASVEIRQTSLPSGETRETFVIKSLAA